MSYTKIKIPVVIFAGGKSSRMGKDKALLPFKGFKTLVEFQYHRLKLIFEDVYISWKSEKVDFEAKSILDDIRFSEISAPTIGLYSSLRYLNNDYIFVISVDSPFFGKEEIEKLFDEVSNKFDIFVPKTENGIEPLISIYNKNILTDIEKMISKNNHRLGKLIKSSNTKYINYDNLDSFTNLNYPADYEKFVN